MKIKTSELTGPALDWVVMTIEYKQRHGVGHVTNIVDGIWQRHSRHRYSTDWAQGGPILSKARISRTIDHSGLWIAYDGYNYADAKQHMQCHNEELVAGLRCFAASKLGDEVDVPEELLR